MNDFIEELFIDLYTLLSIVYFVCVYEYIGFEVSISCLFSWGLYLLWYIILLFVTIFVKNNIERIIIKS